MSERNNMVFFTFSVKETKEDIVKRLQDAKRIGFDHLIASYKTEGMEQVKFDEAYFRALDCMTEACKEEQVKFILEDYAPFPTGSANGAYGEEEYAELNKLFIDERHVDFCGPMAGAVVRIDTLQSVVYGKTIHRFTKVNPACRKRICTVAYKMQENPANAAAPLLDEATGIILDEYIENGILKWNIPEGHWRILVIYTTYESSGRAAFMNMLSKESVALEIEKVHRPLYEHLKEELGSTWMGFFYDEPEVGNAGGDSVFDYFMLPGRRTADQTDCEALSWSPEMPKEMEKRDDDWMKKLPALWYDGISETYKDYRCDYMDAVSSLIRENYNGQVYAFCKERGIYYIGHVLEDENCHTRLGCGPAHYFRQQYYQSEAGMDVIAGQILPGKDSTTSWYGVANSDGEFYHYGLAKLPSSEAHINPLKKNRAVSEVFAMYGQQGLAERKFLLDHLMVNGINRMLFAELPSYQASWEYSRAVADYTERMCSLLRASEPVIKTAILYHAENEWREGFEVQKFQKAGAKLAGNQISYDVIPADVFAHPDWYHTETEEGLTINSHKYEAFIIPACDSLPKAVGEFVKQCAKTGFPVFFVNYMPQEFESCAENGQNISCVPLAELAEVVRRTIHTDIQAEGSEKKWLRYSHQRQSGAEYYLLHNEAPCGEVDCQVTLPQGGKVLEWDVMTDRMLCPKQESCPDGSTKVSLHFGQYEMKVLLISDKKCTDECVVTFAEEQMHQNNWTIELPDGRLVKAEDGSLPGPEDYVGYEFYGKLIYRTTFDIEKTVPEFLELGMVSDCCEVFVNGQSAGKRCAAPYRYQVEELLREGKNEITSEVYTSASNIKSPVQIFGAPLDALTAVPYTNVEKMGISGPVKWVKVRSN